MNPAHAPKVLAISSGGGHWVQLLRLRPAFEGCDLTFVTVDEGYRVQVEGTRFLTVPDSNRWEKLSALRCAFQVFLLLTRERPEVVVSTGAAPGFFAILFGKFLGARTVFMDSIANAEELSLSGRMAGKFADLWLTQWPHLADGKRLHFRGNVL